MILIINSKLQGFMVDIIFIFEHKSLDPNAFFVNLYMFICIKILEWKTFLIMLKKLPDIIFVMFNSFGIWYLFGKLTF